MGKLKSTVPGLEYPSGRDLYLKSGHGFLEGRRIDDGAEGLWRIRNGLYDLENWLHKHPGGAEWLTLTKGTDITEAFECHHLTDRAENLLPKFYVRDAKLPRKMPFTFMPNGFYQTFKKRAVLALKNVNFHHPARSTNLIADFLVSSAILFSLMATKFWLAIIPAALFLTWSCVIGHNYLHMRDTFRMFYMDLSFFSTREWRITHVLSHHLYPNTIWDVEVYALEPFFQWLPNKNKSFLKKCISVLITPVVYALALFGQIIKRYYLVFRVWKQYDIRDIIPFSLPLLMSIVAPNFSTAVKTWIIIIFFTSLFFHFIGFNAAHHHPDIFHDGDIARKDQDWGLLELDAVRGREVVDDSLFLALTNFGSHTLHHLLPTVDHAYLPLCLDAYYETCKEFRLNPDDKMTYWQHVKGQFQQLTRIESKYNSR